MTAHVYPAHAHADWALLLVDVGAVVYDLGGRAHVADRSQATLLPPGIAHDGRAAQRSAGFRKRVAYLDARWMSEALVGAVVDRPARADLVGETRSLHRALATPGAELAAEEMLVSLADRFTPVHSQRHPPANDRPLARRLRDLLEARLTVGITLAEAGRLLGAHPSHLSRSFVEAFGLPPHRYVTSRRVDLARRLLLDGTRPAAAAAAAGFHDQAHLTRHFRRVLSSTPARFARADEDPPRAHGRGA